MADANGHRHHDPVAISASVDPGLAMPPSLSACLACFGLRADLLVIRSFLAGASIPRRRRDFRLTTADAERLRRRGWRRLVATIGTTRDGLTRPLAASFTALGLAGVLLGAVSGGLAALGTSGSAGAAGYVNPASVDTPLHPVTPRNDGPARLPVAGEGPAEVAGATDSRVMVPVNTSALSTVSLAMLGVGTSLFAVRRLVSGAGRMR